jgi:hypothetical protein
VQRGQRSVSLTCRSETRLVLPPWGSLSKLSECKCSYVALHLNLCCRNVSNMSFIDYNVILYSFVA